MAQIRPVIEKTDRESTLYLQINNCDISRGIKFDYSTLRENGRSDYQLLYVQQGKLIVEICQMKRELLEGQLIIFLPHQRQFYTFLQENKPITYWIHFTGTAVPEILDCLIDDDKPIYTVANRLRFETAFLKLIRYNHLNNDLKKNSQFLKVLDCINESSNQEVVSSELQSAFIYLHDHYYEAGLSIKELAECAHLSTSRFSHLFTQTFGLSPYKYVMKLRLEQACDLLGSSSLGIGEIGQAMGFSSQAHFYHSFLKEKGLSPSAYRKKCEQQN